MVNNTENKIECKDKIFLIIKENKYKLLLLSIVLITTIIIINFIKLNNEKKNALISEKYIQAGLYLSKNDTEKSKILLEEVILSKNNFYTILALNVLVEKKLEKDKTKIMKYYEIAENLNITEDRKNILLFKKALYLIKNSDAQGYDILKNLVNKDPTIKLLAEGILDK